MYLLEVLSGPLDGKTWPFELEITIGRDDALADACLALDRYVSRKHAKLRIEAGAIRLVDLRSRNGTRLSRQARGRCSPAPSRRSVHRRAYHSAGDARVSFMESVSDVAQARALLRALPRPLGFVPTMGALHEGHLELIARARDRSASVAASIFVNPLQFGANEDLATYPRDLDADRRKLAAAGVDVLFAPENAAMYPPGFATVVEVGPLGTILRRRRAARSFSRRCDGNRKAAEHRAARRALSWAERCAANGGVAQDGWRSRFSGRRRDRTDRAGTRWLGNVEPQPVSRRRCA